MTDDQVEEVRAAAPVEEIIGEFVPLRRSGRSWMGKCPFHEDSSPSFSVVPGQGYRCFGCGETGDIFTFVMKRVGLDFPEAVRWVAAKVGIVIQESRGRDTDDPLRPLFETNAFAADFYRQRLLDPEVGKAARGYLESRGITGEVSERFQLGYAPDAWRELRDAAVRHGIDDALLLDVGLTTTSERSGEPYDRFRNRIVFPIEGMGGRILAFGGRILPGGGSGGGSGGGGGGPKYLNSPETPIYHKGEVLYGLPRARHAIRSLGFVLVVEGYMDLVALHSEGFEQTVATLGTATTPEQGRLLARYTKRALLLFDSDTAGTKAAFRAADVLLAEGIHPSVVTLPQGEDPDTLVRGEGAAALKRYLDGAVDVVDRKLQMLDERGFFGSIEGTRKALDRLLPTLRAAKDPALRDLYVARVASRTGVRRETLEGELAGDAGPGGSSRQGGWAGPARNSPRRPTPLPLPRLGAERELVRLLLRDRDWIERAMERVGPDDFTDAGYRSIFMSLVEDPELNQPPEGMDPGAARRLEELLGDPSDLLHPGEIFEAAVSRMLEAGIELRLEDLDRRLKEAGSFEEQRVLLEERARLTRESRAGRVDWLPAARHSARVRQGGEGAETLRRHVPGTLPGRGTEPE
jgi:DNA primase